MRALCSAAYGFIAEYDRSVTAARTRLGEDAFVAAWKEGRAMSMEQAIAAALEKEAGG
jgi:hypothetical protein